MRGNQWSVAGVAAVLLAGCAGAGPAGPPQGAPSTATVVVSVAGAAPAGVPLPVVPAPAGSGETSCARGARPMPSPDPSASFDLSDPAQRARRALAQQQRPVPTRGVVPAAAVPGAEACVHALEILFSLLSGGSRTVPDERTIEAALRSAGLTKIVIRSGPVFAASSGAACVHGSFTATGPAFIIGPLTTDGTCRPLPTR